MRVTQLRNLGLLGLLALGCAPVVAACGSDSGSPAKASGASGDKTIAVGISSNNVAAYSAMAQGTQAYLEYVNAKGGVNGYKFTTEVLNNDATANGGVTSVRQLLQKKPSALVVVGSAAFAAGANVIKQMNPEIPVAAMAGATVVQASGLKNAFGASASYPDECAAQAGWASKTLNAKSAVIVYEDDAIGQDVGKTCPGVAESVGMKVTKIPVPPTTTNFGPIAAKVKQAGADVVMVYAQTPYMVGVQKAAAALGVTSKWITFSTNDDTYVKLAGKVAEGTYVDRWLYPLTEENDSIAAFKQYQSKLFGEAAVSGLGLQGWTTGAALAEAIGKATSGGKSPDGPAIAAAVRTLNGPVGGSPSIDYAHTDGSTGITQVAMYQVKDGAFVKVSDLMPVKS